MKHIFKYNRAQSVLFVFFIVCSFFLSQNAFAAWSGEPYNAGETLNPECGPTDDNCTVINASTAWVNADNGITYTGGNVGIGADTPSSLLHISGAVNNLLTLQSTIGDEGNTANLDFQTYTTLNGALSPTARISAIDDGSYSSGLAFLTKNPGADQNDLVERLRIASNGNVGIATTNPLAKFDIAGNMILSGTDDEDFRYLNFGNTSGVDGFGIRNNDGTMQFKDGGGSWADLGSGGSSQWQDGEGGIHYTDGNVGIGANEDQNAALTVQGESSYGVLHIIGQEGESGGESAIGFRSENVNNGDAGNWVMGSNVGGVATNGFALWSADSGNVISALADG